MHLSSSHLGLVATSVLLIVGGLPIAGKSADLLPAKESVQYAIHGIDDEIIDRLGPIKAANLQTQGVFQNTWSAVVFESGLISDLARKIAEQGQGMNNEAASLLGLKKYAENRKSKECITYLYLAYQDSSNESNPSIGGEHAIKCIESSLEYKTPLLTLTVLNKVLANNSTKLNGNKLKSLKVVLEHSSEDLWPVHEFSYYQATNQLTQALGKTNKDLVVQIWTNLYNLYNSGLRGSSYCGFRISAISSALNQLMMADVKSVAKELRDRQLDNTQMLIDECYSSETLFPTEEMIYGEVITNMNSVISSILKGNDPNNKSSLEQETRALSLARSAERPSKTSGVFYGLSLIDIEITHIGLLDARGASKQAKEAALSTYRKLSRPDNLGLEPERYISVALALIPQLGNLGLNDEASILGSRIEKEIFQQKGIPAFQKTYAIDLLSREYVKASEPLKASALWSRYILNVFIEPSYTNKEKADTARAYSSFIYFERPDLFYDLVIGNSDISRLRKDNRLLDARILVHLATLSLEKGKPADAREFLLQAQSSLKLVNDEREYIAVSSIEDDIKSIDIRLRTNDSDEVAYWSQWYDTNLQRYGELHRLTLTGLYELGIAKIFKGKIQGKSGGLIDLIKFVEASKKASRIETVDYRLASLYVAILESFFNNDKHEAAKYLAEFYKSKRLYRESSLRFLDTDKTGKEIVEQLTTYLISPYILEGVNNEIYKEEVDDLITNRGLSIEADIARRMISSSTSDSLTKSASDSKKIRQILSQGTGTFSVADIQSLLDEETRVFIITVARPVSKKFLAEVGNDPSEWDSFDRYVILEISKDSISRPIDIGEKRTIDKIGKQARNEITSPTQSSFQALRKLQAIWGKAKEKSSQRFKKTHLVSTGIFTKIPRALLVDEDNSHEAQGLFVSEASLARYLNGSQQSTSEEIVVFADPNYGDTRKVLSGGPSSRSVPRALDNSGLWQRLPATLAEAEFLRSKAAARIYTGDNASKRNLIKIDSPKILHLATHAYYEDSVSDFSQYVYSSPLDNTGIVLSGVNINADSSVATARDILSLNLQGTELVVLSACESALGDTPTNMSVYGLQRSFEVAGARSVLAALWKVDDRATAEFIKAFYSQLIKGLTKPAALKAAQQYFKNHPIQAWRHPYYWAAFELYGSPKKISFLPSNGYQQK